MTKARANKHELKVTGMLNPAAIRSWRSAQRA